eukprot:TRINITY_DN54712_c0_g1_i1.p1 TRINITY_DN54712_c0_g1~~TRINITY_DN54712_c0_g1_i1.p1  ORF type:complete len:273 (+),score=33.59 TRINITY_DN54712_c0_g1_i1:181-999(+)
MTSVVKLLAEMCGKQAVFALRRRDVFFKFAWPCLVTSIRLSAKKGVSMVPLQRSIAAFARQLFHGVALPWCRCLRGKMQPDSFENRVACSQGPCIVMPPGAHLRGGHIEASEWHCEFLRLPDLQGAQALQAELMVCSGKLFTRSGVNIETRVPYALAKLQEEGVWQVLEQKVAWLTEVRYGTREYACLKYSRVISFRNPAVRFTIQGRVLPFFTTEDDDLLQLPGVDNSADEQSSDSDGDSDSDSDAASSEEPSENEDSDDVGQVTIDVAYS